MDRHLLLVLLLGVLSGFFTPLTMHFVFMPFTGINKPAEITARLLPKIFLATILAILAIGIIILGPLYLFGLIPLLGAAPLYGLSLLVGSVLSRGIFWRSRKGMNN
jgi:hypothetical protein